MAPFPVAPVYSPHALMKTRRLALLPKTCEYTLHVCAYMWECLSACVPLGQPRLTSCCKLLPVDSGVFLLMTLCCMSVLSASRFNPCLILCACVCACLCLRMGTRVCCVCLLLFFPEADHFIHLSTIIKPIKREVLPYGWTSLFFHFLLQVLEHVCDLSSYIYTLESTDYAGAVVECERNLSQAKKWRCGYYSHGF